VASSSTLGRRFEGQVCVVTGAGQGIGRATAHRLGGEGGRIVLVDRAAESARRVEHELTGLGIEAEAMIADLAELPQVRAVMEKTVEKHGRIDVLCNVVGGTIWWQPYHCFTEEQIRRELDRSLFPTLWCCSAALPAMLRQRSGAIVNLSSMVVRGELYRAPYAVSKGGIEALTRTLAAEYGPYGIRVNAVSPGQTHIEDRITSRLDLGGGTMAAPNEDYDRYLTEGRTDPRTLALRRPAGVEEQAAAIAFAASSDASYLTGQILNCFGDP
jgi:NAD(P)-dependent dehydrogenase (short-subunit alcohol dehydrogenase family)